MNEDTLTKDLLIPFYCENCRNPVFLHKSGDSSDLTTLDWLSSFWKQHPCEYLNNEPLLDDESLRELADLEWGVKNIPFELKGKKEYQNKQSKTAWGIILSIPEEKGAMLKTLTADNIVIQLRMPFNADELSAGMLIDLSNMTRVGSKKYRLPKLKQIVIPAKLDAPINIPDEFCQLSVSAVDQEQLEGFVNRLMRTLLDERISISMVTACPVNNEVSPPVHTRKLTVYPVPGLIKRLENALIPDSITMSAIQVGAGSFAKSAVEK